jgi:Fe-S cluster biogenesis protein NfuA
MFNVLARNRPRLYLKHTRQLFIQTETTPNENSLKFIPGIPLLRRSDSYEFSSPKESIKSPLVGRLFEIEGVQSVFVAQNFITVTKNLDIAWPQLKPQVYEILMDYLNSHKGESVVNEESRKSDTDDPEVVQMIKELMDTRIRHVVQSDGGDVQFVKFENGILYLRLQGACRTCASSEITLKHGIERMIMHYIPEVEKVVQVEDEVTELGKKVFDEFESNNK